MKIRNYKRPDPARDHERAMLSTSIVELKILYNALLTDFKTDTTPDERKEKLLDKIDELIK